MSIGVLIVPEVADDRQTGRQTDRQTEKTALLPVSFQGPTCTSGSSSSRDDLSRSTELQSRSSGYTRRRPSITNRCGSKISIPQPAAPRNHAIAPDMSRQDWGPVAAGGRPGYFCPSERHPRERQHTVPIFFQTQVPGCWGSRSAWKKTNSFAAAERRNSSHSNQPQLQVRVAVALSFSIPLASNCLILRASRSVGLAVFGDPD
jgi:hypothetical protein